MANVGALAEYAPVYLQGPPPPGYAGAAAPVSANPLDELMGPVALYPDPLISLLLPAAAFPSDIAAAGAYLNGGAGPGQIDLQPWDPSVRALAHYPDVVVWMAQNEPWTQTVGAAFVSQPADVMNSIQRLRELARAAGTLSDTPQQVVIVQGGYVEIEPAQPNVIYVPRYDPAVVYVDQPYTGYGGPFFTYGPAYGAGNWLTYGVNWYGGGVMIVGADYWHGNGGWRRPDEGISARAEFGVSGRADARPWGFPANRPRPQAPSGWQNQSLIVRVRVARGSPPPPPQAAYRNIHTRGPAAVAVVAANPAAFRGKPLNHEIMAKPAVSAPRSAVPSAQPTRPRPAPAAQPRPTAASPAAQPRPPAPAAARPEPGAPTAQPRATATPQPENAAKGRTQPDARPADTRTPPPKPVVKKAPKPAPKDDRGAAEKANEEKPKPQPPPGS